jgi:hypothetical protein
MGAACCSVARFWLLDGVSTAELAGSDGLARAAVLARLLPGDTHWQPHPRLAGTTAPYLNAR